MFIHENGVNTPRWRRSRQRARSARLCVATIDPKPVQRRFEVLMLGSTTNQVLRHAACPVLTL